MSSYDIVLRPASASPDLAEVGAQFDWPSFEVICRRVHERALRAGHARLAQASTLYSETETLDLDQLDDAAWKLVIEEMDAILADADFFAFQKELREKEHFIQGCQREGLDPDEALRRDRQSTEVRLRFLRDKLTGMVERGEGPSPRGKYHELLRHSVILFRPLSYALHAPAETSACFFGRPFEEICRRIEEHAVSVGNVKLAEAAKYARLDGFMKLYELDAAEWRLVIAEVDALLRDVDFFAYEKEQNAQAWFIEKCQHLGETTGEFQRGVRESTMEQLRHLREKLTAMVG